MVRIKGVVVNDSIKAVKAHFGDQVYNSIVERLQGETRQLFERTSIMPSDWYSLDAFVEFLEMNIRLTAQGNELELIRRSEALVEQHLKGIYKLFVKFGSPEFVLNRLAVVHKAYFQGVEIEVSVPGPGKGIVRYIGFAKEHRLIGMSIIGYFRKALEISGARDVKAGFTTSIDEGKGFCELVLSWTGKS
jgi:hypothetical protein